MSADVQDRTGEHVSSSPPDAARVPVYPIVHLELRPSGVIEGTVDGYVNGTLLVSAMTESDARARLLGEAADAAARRPMAAIRVRLVGFGSDAPRGRRSRRGAADEEAAEGIVTATGALSKAGAAKPSRRPRRRFVILASLVLVTTVAAVAGLVAVSKWARSARGAAAAAAPVLATTPPPTQLPVLAPAGWSTVAAWSLPLPGAGTLTVSTAGERVWAPARDGSGVVCVEAASGRQMWATSTSSRLVGGPALKVVGGRSLLVGWTSAAVLAWDPSTGIQQGEWPIPSGGQVKWLGESLIVTQLGQHVFVFTGTDLVSRVVPAGAVPVGVTPEGALVAAAPARAWVITSSTVAGDGQPLAGPDGMAWSAAVAVVDRQLIAAYAPNAADTRVVLRSFGLGDWTPGWSSELIPGSFGSLASPLQVSAGGDWGVYGSSALNLATGAAAALPNDWSTTGVSRDMAFGASGGVPLAVDRAGRLLGGPPLRGPRVGSVAAPVAATDGGMALVIATDGTEASVYAVPRLS